MEHVSSHFKKVDPVLFALIRGEEWTVLKRTHDHFSGLCRIIIGQQVSTKAARAIFERFRALFPRKRPKAELVLAMDDATLRSAGLSGSKVAAVRDLAARVASKSLDLKKLNVLDTEMLTAELVQVRGIGRWSAEMFMIFYLGREDVFSPGDLGLRTAIMKAYRKRRLPTEEEAVRIARKWAPYRSYACRILWKSLDNDGV